MKEKEKHMSWMDKSFLPTIHWISCELALSVVTVNLTLLKFNDWIFVCYWLHLLTQRKIWENVNRQRNIHFVPIRFHSWIISLWIYLEISMRLLVTPTSHLWNKNLSFTTLSLTHAMLFLRQCKNTHRQKTWCQNKWRLVDTVHGKSASSPCSAGTCRWRSSPLTTASKRLQIVCSFAFEYLGYLKLLALTY